MSIGRTIWASGLLPSSPAAIAEELGLSVLSVRSALKRGARAGLFSRKSHGMYDLGEVWPWRLQIVGDGVSAAEETLYASIAAKLDTLETLRRIVLALETGAVVAPITLL